MRINTTDPDLQTIFSRIDDGSLDLQPDFQRAEVWKSPKKKLLVDTILRGWQIPPVHVIFDEDSCVQEVLDGQQRLSAVRDFMSDEVKINGFIEPIDEALTELDGLTYSQLPLKVQNRVNRYAIRFFEIVEYNHGEPGELFNRLNESLKLTSAEKRNAYVGKLRTQMKHLVDALSKNNIDSKFLGFSNQRLAYHDLFIKLCYLIEEGKLTATYTDKQLNDRARDDESFDEKVIESVYYGIEVFGAIKSELESQEIQVHITKATFFSWLYFISIQYKNKQNDFNNDDATKEFVSSFVSFESPRFNYRKNLEYSHSLFDLSKNDVETIFAIFNERASSRVMTASSLLIRDAIIKVFYLNENDDASGFDVIFDLVDEINTIGAKAAIENYADNVEWEAIL